LVRHEDFNHAIVLMCHRVL